MWLGNYRGNTYSRNHTFLNPDALFNHKFWDFTWDEMAKYDIPSMVEKVLEVTGEEEIFYAGHSMGTTAFMAMGHYRPDILDRWGLITLENSPGFGWPTFSLQSLARLTWEVPWDGSLRLETSLE